MYDITLQQLLLRVVAFLAIAAVHGLAVAGTTRLLGDDGPRHDGRLTANPIRHADLIGALGVILFSLGWIRPIAIETTKLRPGRWGLVVVVVAGSAAAIALAAFASMLRVPALTTLGDSAAMTVDAWCKITVELAVWFALFNLLPIPPLTGAHLLAAINPAWRAREKHVIGFAVGWALAIVALPIERVLAPWFRLVSAPLLN
jgi:Zn-dependent protease